MPERTCIGCRATRDPASLLRYRRSIHGRVVPATSRRSSLGRSAYLCPNRACLQQARKRRAFSRSFARSGAILLDPRQDEPWDQLWSMTAHELRDAVERIPTQHSRRRGLEQLLFELSSQPAAPVESPRAARAQVIQAQAQDERELKGVPHRG